MGNAQPPSRPICQRGTGEGYRIIFGSAFDNVPPRPFPVLGAARRGTVRAAPMRAAPGAGRVTTPTPIC